MKDKKGKHTLTLLATMLAVVGLGLGSAAAFLPGWIIAPAQPRMSWGMRYVGLFKLSSQYTNVLKNPTDQTWMVVRDKLCGLAAGNAGNLGAGATALITSKITDMLGAECKLACQTNLYSRCGSYKTMFIMGYVIAGFLVLGGSLCLMGAAMPYFSKEKKSDKRMNFTIMVSGALIACAGPLTFYFWTSRMFSVIGETSWYPPMPVGYAFFMGVAGAGSLLVALIPQGIKLRAKKAPVLEGAEVDVLKALDPTLLDPAFL